MQKYELLLILPGTLDDKEVEARCQEIVGVVKSHAEKVDVQSMGKNRLAYPVKQIRYGYYYTVVFEAEKTELKKLQDKLALMRDVLRAVVTHFNISLTPAQKAAYAAEGLEQRQRPEVQPTEEKAAVEAPAAVEEKTEEKVAVASQNARPAEKLDMDAITKKLDDLMSGDVIPGV